METQTEKIQEMFNKELEDIKNKQRDFAKTLIRNKMIEEGIWYKLLPEEWKAILKNSPG